MGQLGRLIIWHNVAPASAYGDFEQWVENEHIPERVGVTGFLRCRRFRGVGNGPTDMNIYDTISPDVFTSDEYVSRLNDPTPWTQRVMPTLGEPFSRSSCRLQTKVGVANGAAVAIYQSDDGWSADALHHLQMDARVVSVEHAVCVETASNIDTTERTLRGETDAVARHILVCDGTEVTRLDAACRELLRNDDKLVGMFQMVFELRSAGVHL